MMCKVCVLPIVSICEEFVVCEGFCSDTFHAECVNLSTDELISCNANLHIWWFCEHCSKMMQEIQNNETILAKRRIRSPSSAVEETAIQNDLEMNLNNAVLNNDTTSQNEWASTVTGDIVELKQQIANILDTLSGLQNNTIFSSHCETPDYHNSPLSSTRLRQGSRKQMDALGSRDLNVRDEKIWIFFTRIKNTVGVQDIEEMVADAIGTDEAIDVKRLVPDWKDVSTMPFISFKVGIDIKHRDIALLPSTWPHGICFREFKDKFNIWEPTNCRR